MKKYCAWILSAVCLASRVMGAEAQNRSPLPDRAAVGATTAIGKPQIVERWMDGRTWQSITTQKLTDGTTLSHTNRWTDLATGMHYWHVDHWKESRAEISITPDGAEARQGPHKVHLAGNINSVGAITITSADDKTLRSHVVGLAYTDLATGESVMIATVRDSVGQLFPPNQVLYPAAFTGIAADLRYTYTRQGFEQDVVLRQSPPPPSDYGLNNETTALEVWTEFDAPEPEKSPATTAAGLTDEMLSFGELRIARGGAFAIDTPEPRMSAAPVGKTWIKANERQYLIESVWHHGVKEELDKLPPWQAVNRGGVPQLQRLAAGGRTEKRSRLAWLNGQETRRAATPTPIRVAVDRAALLKGPALVLDYIIYGGNTTNFTFQADTTYLISDSINIYGSTTIEGGTVIKIGTTNNTMIQAYGSVVLRTDPYRPAIITSQNDATVGLDFTAPGSPMKAYGGISTAATPISYKHMRLANLGYALSGYSINLIDVQFVDCNTALYEHYYSADVDNVLFYKVGRAFAGTAYNIRARNITVNQCGLLTDDFAAWATAKVALTNSLLVNVTNWGVGTVTTNFTVTTSSNLFQTVGAGAHYLGDFSPFRNAGTTNIPPPLAARLRKTTTYPPVLIGGFVITNTTLNLVAPRDTGVPDLGYHYDPLDYVANRLWITNATLTVAEGVAIAGYATNSNEYLAVLAENGSFICEGSASRPNHLVSFYNVQEQVNTNWQRLPYFLLTPWWNATPGLLRCRFTEFSSMVGGPYYFENWDSAAPTASFTDCQFYGNGIYAASYPTDGARLTFTNNLFHRVNSLIWADDVFLYNNTFYHGALDFLHSGNAALRDNAFDSTSLSQYFDVTNSHNAYTTNCTRFTPTGTNDVVVNSISWQAGTLGRFYLTNNTALLNKGSRNATNAGLYHFTMLTNNVKETNTVVDIGFHYVATDANGIPFDYDLDGLPDYWEDHNGNGSIDSNETDPRGILSITIDSPSNGSTVN